MNTLQYETICRTSPDRLDRVIRLICDADARTTIADDLDHALTVGELTLMRALVDLPQPTTFVCRCGEYEHPIEPGDDESIWCECGLRLDYQREHL